MIYHDTPTIVQETLGDSEYEVFLSYKGISQSQENQS